HVDSRLTGAGYIHYEISNYAFPGRESRHNSAYWNGTPYLGLGPSAHSFDGDTRRYNPADVKTYIESLQAGYTCCEVDEETIENKFNDYLITRLRTSAGLSLTDLSHRPYGYLADRLLEPVRRLQSAGLLEVDGDRITIPKSGWLASDAILRDLII
ncbi:MAG: coproporphyrinogen III oxidase family protein, partial [Muribaculaceae bacterium]|nr:coproporphyrinogen III oxidase family protein [Muribaculaceae bacterium]